MPAAAQSRKRPPAAEDAGRHGGDAESGKSLKRTILQPGYARPYEQTPIYSRVPGYVESAGGHRRPGEERAICWQGCDVPELEKDFKAKTARVGQAEAQVKQARAAYEAAKANVETTKANVLEAFAAIARGEAEFKRWTAEVERGRDCRPAWSTTSKRSMK